MPEIQIHPSILAADKNELGAECRRMQAAGADGLHVDIMDGSFVRNISLGFQFIAAVHETTTLPLSVHLMIVRPDEYVEPCVEGGSHTVFIHAEAPCDVAATLKRLRRAGVRAGLTLNPESPSIMADDYYGLLDAVLFMSVHPGFGGQDFIPQVLDKVRRVRRLRPDLDLCIDGGINRQTAVRAAACGINVFFVGTSVFRARQPDREIAELRRSVSEAYCSDLQGLPA